MVATRTGAKDDTYREAHNKKHPPKFTLKKKCARLPAQEAAPAAAAAAAAAAPQETHCVSPAQNMPQLRRATWEVLIGSDVSLDKSCLPTQSAWRYTVSNMYFYNISTIK